MNGSYCETRFVPNGKSLILNGSEVRELIRETEALKFLAENSNEVNTIPKEVLVSREDLIKTFKNLNDTLRSEGLRAGIERFSEFANILFLKLLSENSKRLWWSSVKNQTNDDIIEYVNRVVIQQIQDDYGGDVFTPLLIKNPQTLRHIIDSLDPLILSTIDTDIKGDAFEYFIEKTTSTDNDLGEYFTPKHVVKTVVNLIAPKFKETVYDPFCGTGGFLTRAFHYIKENNIIKDDDLNTLKCRTFFGREITTTARIAKMNMILHGDGHSGIQQTDSLANPDFLDKDKKPLKFDVVITNMPFSQTITRKVAKGGKIMTENHISPLYYNGIAKNNGDAACVLHCLRSLKEGGRMALIVPEGFLFRKDIANVREFLLSKANLQSVISLPQGTFLPYTGVKTDILYLTEAHKPNNQKSYWFFDVKNTGVTLDNHQRKIKGLNDFNKIDSSDVKKVDQNPALKDNMLEIGFESIELEKVKRNNYNLVGKQYLDKKSYSDHQFVRLSEICDHFEYGYTDNAKESGDVRYVRITDIQEDGSLGKEKKFICLNEKSKKFLLRQGDVVIARIGSVGKSLCFDSNEPSVFASYLIRLHFDHKRIFPKYLKYCFESNNYWDQVKNLTSGAVQPQLNAPSLRKIEIPLPPIEKQKEIVSELDIYSGIVEGAKQIIDRYKPQFSIRNTWQSKTLGEVCNFISRGKTPKYGNGKIQVIKSGQIRGFYDFNFAKRFYLEENFDVKNKKLLKNDILINSTGVGTAGRVAIFSLNGEYTVDSHVTILRLKNEIIPQYLLYFMAVHYGFDKIEKMAQGSSGQVELNLEKIKSIIIKVPSLHIQQGIVEQLEAERRMIESNKEIISYFSSKIRNRLDSLWESDKEKNTKEKVNPKQRAGRSRSELPN